MSPTIEKIIQEIDLLPQSEQSELTSFLVERREAEPQDEDAEVAAAWDAEIDERVASVMNGTAKLTPGKEFKAQMESFIADLKAGRNPADL